MIKAVKHSAAARTSIKVLWRRVRYIADPDDKNHEDKEVLPSRNYHCTGNTMWHFLLNVVRRFQKYKKRREGKRGKRTKKKWEEYVYSSPNGSMVRDDGTMEPCLNSLERDMVERCFLAGPLGCGSARLGWHICKVTGRCDLHILTSIHDDHGVIWTNDQFGHGKKNLKLELERIEEEFLRQLNRQRANDRQLQTPRHAHIRSRKEAGKKTLAQKLAALGWHGQHDKLAAAVQQLGYKVFKQTAKTITIDAPAGKPDGKEKRTRYTISTLAGNGGSGGMASPPGGPQPGSQGLGIIGPDM